MVALLSELGIEMEASAMKRRKTTLLIVKTRHLANNPL